MSGYKCPFGLLFLWMMLGVFEPVLAQDLRWGRIPDDHLSMRVFEADTSASAVILGESGTVHFLNDMRLVFEVHRRVKVLSERGYDLGTVEFLVRTGGGAERIRRLEGHTFVPAANGRTERVRLRDDAIFREDLGDDHVRVRFTMPALEPGAVFEYRYTIVSESPHAFPSWTFQDVEPTLFSEFSAEVPTFLIYNRFRIGAPVFDVERINEREFDLRRYIQHQSSRQVMGSRTGHAERSGGGRRYDGDTNTYHWVMRDIPALREEDFVASVWDHAAALRFQLSAYYDHNGQYISTMTSWDEIARQLLRGEYFGRHLTPSGPVRRQAESLVADAEDAQARLGLIYDFVRSGIVWDERYRFGSERSIGRVLETRRGSSGEINLLLLGLLRAANIDAHPVLISTRRHGRVIPFFPLLSQFNHVVVLAVAEGRPYFLDATDPHRPAGMLPVAALNHDGWLLMGEQQRWIEITPTPGTSSVVDMKARLSADGSVSGTLSRRITGYAALNARQRMKREQRTGEPADGAEVGRAFTFSDVEVEGLEGDGAIVYNASFSVDEHAQPLAHLLAFNPVLMSRMERNPFRQATRTYPVDFAYSNTEVFQAELELPDGYGIEEMPGDTEFAVADGGGVYRRTLAMDGRTLRVQRQLVLGKSVYEPDAYPALRAFFDQVAAADAEVVVLGAIEGGALAGEPAGQSDDVEADES